MSKVFTSDVFIKKLKYIATLPTIYYSGGGKWSSWNGKAWLFDCVVSVKSVLWGWCEDKKAAHGGAKYKSNGVPDFTCNGALKYCTDVSTNFSNLTPGEYLCMKGTQYNHTGIYLGDGKVFEVTTAWGVNGATISDIDKNGKRSRKGKQSLRWTYHGKLNYIDYSTQPQPIDETVNVYYRVKTQKYGWLSEVKNLNDYAGYKGDAIIDFMVRVDKGSVAYQAHIKGKKWLPAVTGYNINDAVNGYAGDDKPIDCLRIVYYPPKEFVKKKRAKYKVNNYPWVYNTEKDKSGDDFAGVYGVTATELRVTIE